MNFLLDPDAKELQRWYGKMTGAARGDCLQVPREEAAAIQPWALPVEFQPQDTSG